MAGIHIGDSKEYKVMYLGNQKISLYNDANLLPLNTLYSSDNFILKDLNGLYLVSKEEN